MRVPLIVQVWCSRAHSVQADVGGVVGEGWGAGIGVGVGLGSGAGSEGAGDGVGAGAGVAVLGVSTQHVLSTPTAGSLPKVALLQSRLLTPMRETLLLSVP